MSNRPTWSPSRAALLLGAAILAATVPAQAEPAQGKEELAVARLQVRSADGARFLALGGFFQARVGIGGAHASSAELSLHRTRLYLFGNPGLKDVRLRLMIGSEGSNVIGVFDAYAEWTRHESFHLRAGRTKLPVFRDWVEAAPLLAGAGRAAPTLAMLPGRAPGVVASGSLFREGIEYSAGVFHGAGDVGPFREGRGIAGTARIVWNVFHRPIDGEVDIEGVPTALVVGGSALAATALRGACGAPTGGIENPRVEADLSSVCTDGLGGPGSRTLAGVEVLLRRNHWDVGGEILAGVERLAATTTRVGGYLRTDHYVPSLQGSGGLRVSRLLERGELRRAETSLEVDAAYYIRGHELKVTSDLGVTRRDGDSLLSPLVRLQVQALF